MKEMGTGGTFHESWHRIANQKVCLRSSVSIRKQLFRGEKWYILHDPFNNQFFRLRPESYEFVSRLRLQSSVEEVWQDCLERHPNSAPGQSDVIQLLAQLYFANLLYSSFSVDSQQLFNRYKKRKQRELQFSLRTIMFVRIPLFDPENLLKRLSPFIRLIINPLGAFIWLTTLILAGKIIIDHYDMLASQAEGVLAPGNLLYLYLCIIVIKTLHEFGHAFVCKRYGGEVHTMGLMFLVFTPLPYMDATSSWSFRNRWHRVFVGSAGIIFELFIAAIATFLWVYSAPGVIHTIAFNVMWLASVSTFLFNANPLLRFDGYYILSDLADIPNLISRSQEQIRYLCERYLFGCINTWSPATSITESIWLTVYGFCSAIYRLVIFTVIILFVSDRFFIAGLLLAFFCFISWAVHPLFQFVSYLFTHPRLQRSRARAISVSFGSLAVLFCLLAFYPFPSHFRAPGIVEAKQFVRVVNNAPGYVRNILVPTGAEVQAGTTLVELSNYSLDLEIVATKAQQKETLALKMQTANQAIADLEAINNRLANIEKKMESLEQQRLSLKVIARKQGRWIAPNLHELEGSWLERGKELGVIINQEAFQFSAVVLQNEASNLFSDDLQKAEVRLAGQGGTPLRVTDFTIIPFKHERLPSAVLGWNAGGQIPTVGNDESGLKASEPFFHISADFDQQDIDHLFHGKSGQIRFTLSSQPLLSQWLRKLHQFFQKRHQV